MYALDRIRVTIESIGPEILEQSKAYVQAINVISIPSGKHFTKEEADRMASDEPIETIDLTPMTAVRDVTPLDSVKTFDADYEEVKDDLHQRSAIVESMPMSTPVPMPVPMPTTPPSPTPPIRLVATPPPTPPIRLVAKGSSSVWKNRSSHTDPLDVLDPFGTRFR
jgi:hypothetical protein